MKDYCFGRDLLMPGRVRARYCLESYECGEQAAACSAVSGIVMKRCTRMLRWNVMRTVNRISERLVKFPVSGSFERAANGLGSVLDLRRDGQE